MCKQAVRKRVVNSLLETRGPVVVPQLLGPLALVGQVLGDHPTAALGPGSESLSLSLIFMTAQVYALARAAKRQGWNPARPFTVPGGPPKQE